MKQAARVKRHGINKRCNSGNKRHNDGVKRHGSSRRATAGTRGTTLGLRDTEEPIGATAETVSRSGDGIGCDIGCSVGIDYDDAEVRASQIDTSAMLSQNTVDVMLVAARAIAVSDEKTARTNYTWEHGALAL